MTTNRRLNEADKTPSARYSLDPEEMEIDDSMPDESMTTAPVEDEAGEPASAPYSLDPEEIEIDDSMPDESMAGAPAEDEADETQYSLDPEDMEIDDSLPDESMAGAPAEDEADETPYSLDPEDMEIDDPLPDESMAGAPAEDEADETPYSLDPEDLAIDDSLPDESDEGLEVRLQPEDGELDASLPDESTAATGENPYWQTRFFWLNASGAIGRAERGDFEMFRQRLSDEGFTEWEIDRHVEAFEEKGKDGYALDPISRKQPVTAYIRVDGELHTVNIDSFIQNLAKAKYSNDEIGERLEVLRRYGFDGYKTHAITGAPSKFQQEALNQLKDYRAEGGGYYIAEAIAAGVPEEILLNAGFAPEIIAQWQPRGNALRELAPYKTDDGYDLVAALKDGVEENTILRAGYAPGDVFEARQTGRDLQQAAPAPDFIATLRASGFSDDEIEARVKLLQSLGAEEYTRVVGELNALKLPSAGGPVTQIDLDSFRDDLLAQGFSDDEAGVRVKLLQSMGAEEYTRVMGELNALKLPSATGQVTQIDLDSFRDDLLAQGFSDDEAETRVKLLQSMGAEEYTRVMGELNALKLPSARASESAGLEEFSRDLETLGHLGDYSEAELDERWRVFQSVGRDWGKYLETTVANVPPLELVPELKRIREETDEAFATEWAMGLGQKKLEIEHMAETYSQPYAGYSPFLEARTELGLGDIRALEELKESRWKQGQSEGFPDLVTPLLEGPWKDKIVKDETNGDKFDGTQEEFEQFLKEYEAALEGSWPGTMPEVVSYLQKKLDEAELLAPDLAPAIEADLEHAQRVNWLQPSFGKTGGDTAVLVSSLALPLRAPLFLLKGFAKFGIRPSAKVLERMIGSEGWRELSGAWRLTHDPVTGRAFGPSPLGNLSESAKRLIADALNWPVASVEDRVATLAVGTKGLASEAYRSAERQALRARQWEAVHIFDDEAARAFRVWHGELKRDVAAGRITQEVANRHVGKAGVTLAGMRELAAASGKSPDWASIKLNLDVGRVVAGGSGTWTYPITTPRVPIPGTVPQKPGGVPWLFPVDPNRMPEGVPERTPLDAPTPTTPLVEPTPGITAPGSTPLIEPSPGRTPLVDPTPDTPSPWKTPLIEPTPTTPLIEPTPDSPPPKRTPVDEPTPRIVRPKDHELIKDDNLPSTVPVDLPETSPIIETTDIPKISVDIADELEVGQRTDTSPAPLPARPSPTDETTRRPPAPWRPRGPLKPPSFEMPSGDALPAGEFPRRVEVIAGFNRKVIDLYTGEVEDYLMPKGQFTNPLKPSFKVLSTGSSRPKRRTLNLGTLQLTVSGSGVEVSPLHAGMRGSGLRSRLRPRMGR